MGKRKSSSKPQTGKKGPPPLDTVFNCVFCNAPKSINIAMDRKENIGHLRCKICGQRFSSVINGLSDPIDVYTEWTDACEEAAKQAQHAEREERAAAGSDDERERPRGGRGGARSGGRDGSESTSPEPVRKKMKRRELAAERERLSSDEDD